MLLKQEEQLHLLGTIFSGGLIGIWSSSEYWGSRTVKILHYYYYYSVCVFMVNEEHVTHCTNRCVLFFLDTSAAL